jgi:acyl-CoA synthetase (NDP forming)
VRDVPAVIDAAMICVPASVVPAVIEDCGAVGVPVAVVVASGFEETKGGDALAIELRETALRTGVRIVGPNTEGVWSLVDRVMLTYGSASAREDLLAGPVSVLSQSGGIGTACIRHLQDRRVGCRYFVGIGNQTDLTSLDFLEYVVDEGGSPVVLLYTEVLRDGWRLTGIARRAAEKGVRIAVLKAGSSDAGRRATATHTGRVASAGRIYSSIFRQAGLLEVHTPTELWEAGETLAIGGRPPPRRDGTGIGIMSISGGCRSLLADACDRWGVAMSTFDPATERKLASVVPSYGVIENPVDPSGAVMTTPGLFEGAVRAVAEDPNSDMIIVQYGNGALRMVLKHLDFYAALREHVTKPLVLCSLGDDIQPDLRERLNGMSILWASDPDGAVKRCAWLYQAAGTIPQAEAVAS